MTDHYFSESPDVEAQPRRISVRLAGRDVEVTTASGVFSPGRLDLGTQVLLRAVPTPPEGNLLDLGCGWGPIALQAALEARDAGVDTQVWAVDVNRRSLALTQENARALGLDSVRPVTADRVPAGLEFDAIWSNPPIRVGKDVLHDLLSTWLPRLRQGGEAWLVVSKNLGADSLRTWIEQTMGERFTAVKHSSAKGFRIILIRRNA